MSEGAVTVRTKKFITNRLLQRRQFLVEVIHPGLAGVSKKDLKEKLAKMYTVADPSCILLYGFKVAFGGGRSTGLFFQREGPGSEPGNSLFCPDGLPQSSVWGP